MVYDDHDPQTGRTHPTKDGRSPYIWLISVQVLSLSYIMLVFPTMFLDNISVTPRLCT